MPWLPQHDTDGDYGAQAEGCGEAGPPPHSQPHLLPSRLSKHHTTFTPRR